MGNITESYQMDFSNLCKWDWGVKKGRKRYKVDKHRWTRSLWVWTGDGAQHIPVLRSPDWSWACRSSWLYHGSYLTQMQNRLQQLFFFSAFYVSIHHTTLCSVLTVLLSFLIHIPITFYSPICRHFFSSTATLCSQCICHRLIFPKWC